MLKRSLFVFIALIISIPAFSQSASYTAFNKRYNYQTVDFRIANIPMHVRVHGLLSDAGQESAFQNINTGNRRGKLTAIYFAGLSLELNASDLKGPKTFNYFDVNNVYFKVINSKGKDSTNSPRTFGVIAEPALKEKIRREGSWVAATSLELNDYLLIDFFDKKTDSLVGSVYFKRLEAKPIVSSVKINDKLIAQDKSEKNLYKVEPDQPVSLMITHYKDWTDSVIQYQLSDPELSDTVWHKAAHHIVLNKLKANTRYILKLRYTSQKETINIITIQIKPYWYQSIVFYWFLGMLVLALIAFNVYFIYRQRLNTSMQERQKIQYELQSVQSQLNPHFIFNSLSSIQGLINTGKVEAANEYLSEFSSIMRLTLANSSNVYHPLHDEIAMLETYLNLEKLRFGFVFSITIDPEVNTSEVEVPNLLFQPLVENSVKHGVSGMQEKGLISVAITKEDKKMITTIRDNGKGFSDHEHKQGHGIKLTKNKIHLINALLGYDAISFQYLENGTVAELTFNNWLT